MTFARVVHDTYNDEGAAAALAAVNSAVDAVAVEAAAIEADGKALVQRALSATPDDAPKLSKAVEALRLRSLRNLLAELQIAGLKIEAEHAVRAAAMREVERQAADLIEHEKTLAKAAAMLGHAPESREHRQLFVTDPTRSAILAARNAAQIKGGNFRALTPDDRLHEMELKAAIAAALK